MINRIMKNSGNKAYIKDLERLDRSAISDEITMISNISYISDDNIIELQIGISGI